MAATSVNGFIADKDGGTDWVEDWDLFEKTSKDFGCTVMGRSTYEEGGSVFDGLQHLVLSSKKRKSTGNIHFVTSVNQAIAKAKELGFDKLLVIGGAQTNESFIRSGKVNKLFVDIHSLKLDHGKKLFGGYTKSLNLKLTSSKVYPEGFTHLEYQVN